MEFSVFKDERHLAEFNAEVKGPCREKGEDRWSPDERELVAGSTPRRWEWDPEAEGVLAGRAG